MSTIGIIAVGLCLASIVSKWLLSVREKQIEKTLTEERHTYREARSQVEAASKKIETMKAEQKQLGAKRTSLQNEIARLEKSRQELVDQEQREEAVRTAQERMIKNLRKKQ